MKKHLIIVAVLSGCAEPPPLRVFQFGPHNRGPHDTELLPEVEEACDILGVHCKIADVWYGSVYTDIVDAAPTQTDARTPLDLIGTCKPMTRTGTDPRLIAHEFLHVLGVKHNAEKEGTLDHPFDGTRLTQEHRDTIDDGLWDLWYCAPEAR